MWTAPAAQVRWTSRNTLTRSGLSEGRFKNRMLFTRQADLKPKPLFGATLPGSSKPKQPGLLYNFWLDLKFYGPIALSVLMVSYLAQSPQAIRHWESKAIFQPAACKPLQKLSSRYLRQGAIEGRFQEMTFVSADDKTRLKGWYFPSRGKDTILLAHGNKGAMDKRADIIEALVKAGYGVFVFDYRGYGNSRGKPSEYGLYQDFWGASRFVEQKLGVPVQQQVAMGESLGGGVVVGAMSRRARENNPMPFKAVILASTFTSIPEVFAAMKKRFGISERWFPLESKFTQRFTSVEGIQDIRSPIFFIHGLKDTDVPSWMADKLQEAVAPGVRTGKYLSKEGAHTGIFSLEPEAVIAELDKFLGWGQTTGRPLAEPSKTTS